MHHPAPNRPLVPIYQEEGRKHRTGPDHITEQGHKTGPDIVIGSKKDAPVYREYRMDEQREEMNK